MASKAKPEQRKTQTVLCPMCGDGFEQRKAGRPKTCSKACAMRMRLKNAGGHSHNYKGGRWKINTGYWKVLTPGHPRADTRGYVLEHLLVMEEVIGRPVQRHETVHHKNGDRADNRPENLQLHVGNHGPGASEKHCPTCTCFEH